MQLENFSSDCKIRFRGLTMPKFIYNPIGGRYEVKWMFGTPGPDFKSMPNDANFLVDIQPFTLTQLLWFDEISYFEGDIIMIEESIIVVESKLLRTFDSIEFENSKLVGNIFQDFMKFNLTGIFKLLNGYEVVLKNKKNFRLDSDDEYYIRGNGLKPPCYFNRYHDFRSF